MAKKPLVVATCLIAGTATASFAATVALDNPNVAASIANFDIGGTLYDVTWDQGSTFVFDGDGDAAANAINAALNLTTAAFVKIASSGASINNYFVFSTSGNNVSTSFSTPGNWDTVTGFGLSGVRAELTVSVSAVPLPAGGLLLLTGFGGIAALKRRKKRAA
ncbi:MAG: VPLPA-CTERM sorting domain-containing protein [Paracoccaceae bacterium]